MDDSENVSLCVTSVNSCAETTTQSLTRSASFASAHSKTEETEETEEKSVSDPKFSDGVALQIEVDEDQTSVKVQVATHTSAAKPEINSNAGADTSPASKTEQSTSENRQHIGRRVSTQLKGYFNYLQSALGVLRNAIEQAQLKASPKPQPSVTSKTPDTVARSNICQGSDVNHDAIIQRAANGHIDALKDAIKNNRDSIFQFVSRQAHKAGIATETRRINGSAVTLEEVPLLTFLNHAVKSKADTNPQGFTSIGSDISVKINTTEADKQQQGAVGYKKSIIEVYCLDGLYTIQVMEVAPSFRNSVLNSDDLQTVRQLYRELENQTAKTQINARPSNGSAPARGAQSPLIYSYAGVGRNATLLTFDLIASEIDDGLITDEAKIEERVREAIDSGRKSEEARLGHKASSKAKPLFVHSDAQIEKIIEAAKGHLKNHLKNVQADKQTLAEDIQLPMAPAAIPAGDSITSSARSSPRQHA